MGKIKFFLSKWFGTDFRDFLLLLLAATVFSILLQGLFFVIGGLFPSIENFGMMIDAIIFMLLVLFQFVGGGLDNRKRNGNIIIGLLAIMGIYISVVWYFHAGILVGCLVLIYIDLWRLYKQGAEPVRLFFGACFCLPYCIGAYFAMIFNGLEPAINLSGIVTVAIATICVWFIH